jgi:hypothetical protein
MAQSSSIAAQAQRNGKMSLIVLLLLLLLYVKLIVILLLSLFHLLEVELTLMGLEVQIGL